MKFFGIIFLAFVITFLAKSSHANTLPINKYAFCSGYAGKMHEIYRLKHYQDMQNYFEKLVGNNKDEFTGEYYQSGSEFVKTDADIKLNINDKCEILYQKG